MITSHPLIFRCIVDCLSFFDMVFGVDFLFFLSLFWCCGIFVLFSSTLIDSFVFIYLFVCFSYFLLFSIIIIYQDIDRRRLIRTRSTRFWPKQKRESERSTITTTTTIARRTKLKKETDEHFLFVMALAPNCQGKFSRKIYFRCRFRFCQQNQGEFYLK